MAAPRILYNTDITINFDRGLSVYDLTPRQISSINDNPFTGARQRLNFFSQYDLGIRCNYASADLRNQLLALWNYIKTGNTLAFWHDPDLKGVWTYEGKSLNDNEGTAPTTATGTMSYPAGKYGLGLSITNQTVYYAASAYFATAPTKGTIAFWFAPAFVVSSNSSNHTLFQLDGASGLGVMAAYWTSINTIVWGVNNSAGGTPFTIGGSVSTLLQNEFHHYAFTWDSTIANGGKYYLDGVLVQTSSNSSFTIRNIATNFRVGYDATDYANGTFDDLLIRSDVLSDFEITQLARTSLWNRRNYFASLMTDDMQFNASPIAGTPNFDIEMNFKEVV